MSPTQLHSDRSARSVTPAVQTLACIDSIEDGSRRMRSVGSALQAVADLTRGEAPGGAPSLDYVQREGMAALIEVLGDSVTRYAQTVAANAAEARRLSTGHDAASYGVQSAL